MPRGLHESGLHHARAREGATHHGLPSSLLIPSASLFSSPPSSPKGQSSRTSAGLVRARRGTASRQSSPTPSPPPPLPRSPLRRVDQAKVRANFAGSVVTIAGRPRRSWSSPWPAITGPLSPLFLHFLSFPVSPRSSYRASLRQLWPDLAGAPSYPSAVCHARWWRCFRAPPVKFVVP
jgi:hypothetical protein